MLTEYFQEMALSKSNSKQKVKQEHYNKKYHLIRYQGGTEIQGSLSVIAIFVTRNYQKKQIIFNINIINVLDEIDDSLESEYDKHEPRLLLCASCLKEYNIPSYYDLTSEVMVS